MACGGRARSAECTIQDRQKDPADSLARVMETVSTMAAPTIRLVPALVLVLLLPAVVQGEDGPAFARDVRPMLEGQCLSCHDALRHRGGIDLSKFKDDESVQ